jgi:hypothetical protein
MGSGKPTPAVGCTMLTSVNGLTDINQGGQFMMSASVNQLFLEAVVLSVCLCKSIYGRHPPQLMIATKK